MAGWRVVSQHQTTELTPNGQFQDVMEVTAQSTENGTHATIRVPIDAYTPENVQAQLDKRFDVLHAVHALGSE